MPENETETGRRGMSLLAILGEGRRSSEGKGSAYGDVAVAEAHETAITGSCGNVMLSVGLVVGSHDIIESVSFFWFLVKRVSVVKMFCAWVGLTA